MREQEFSKGFRREEEVFEMPELDPEALKIVMAKVRDVEASGNAFSMNGGRNYPSPKEGEPKPPRVDLDFIKSVFKNGLLGGPKEGKGLTEGAEADPTLLPRRYVDYGKQLNVWIDRTKKGKINLVHFNIAGRSKVDNEIKPQHGVETSLEISQFMYSSGRQYGFMFDANDFKEMQHSTDWIKQKVPHRSFRSYDKQHFTNPASEYGFALRSRVPPKFLKGLLLNFWQESHPFPKAEYDPKEHEKQVAWAAQAIIAANPKNPRLWVPIYDFAGDLRWPKKMSYEEVKKFVEERDKAKKP